MIKISYGKEGLVLKSDKDLSERDFSNIMKLIKVIDSDKSTTLADTASVSAPINSDPVIDFSSKDRLPNSTGQEDDNSDGPFAVDLSKLDVQEEKIKTHKNFRCPDCGQSRVAIIDGNTVVRDLQGDRGLFIVSEEINPITCTEKELHKSTLEEGVFIVESEDIHGDCPVCGGKSTTLDWVQAYNKPLNFFEYEEPCPMCGSETTMNILEHGKNSVRCENEDCSYTLKGGN